MSQPSKSKTNSFNSWQFNVTQATQTRYQQRIPHVRAFIKTFPGATIKHMHSYLEPTIGTSPDSVIIMCGTNNLKKEPPELTANKLIDHAIPNMQRVKKVAVSSILHRGDSEVLEVNRQQVNRLVKIGLIGIGIEFIMHNNIDHTHLDNWGLDL